MNQKKIILIVVVLIIIAIILGLVFYFQGRKKEGIPGTEGTSGLKEEKKEETITPLRLDYTINNFGPGGANTFSYYIEKKKSCDNREAYLGLMKAQSNDKNSQPQYAKITIFTDNGEMAVTSWSNETNMAFDDITPFYNELNFPLMLNELFVYAGKNFNSNEYWKTENPILLKNVSTGRSKGDYSIIPLEEDSSGLVPCKKFKIVMKTTNTDGYFTACVARKVGDISLPFIVSFAFQNEQGPSWELKSFANEKSGIAWVPQCLKPVVCNYTTEPSQAERTSCSSKGGQIENDFDEQGCIKEYKCLTQLEIAKTAIARVQNPACQINQTVLNKYLQCRKNNMPNFDPVAYDNQGCLTDINCR